jgi:DNA-binding transcriptional LysR family regulator
MRVDPHLLRTFVAVARCGSFSGAARQLGYTQAAVSQHIAALEADLGVALLHRRPVTPTEAGARLLEHAGPILLRLDAARADVVRLAAAPPTRLLLGAAPLAAMPLAASALANVRQSMPRLEVTVRVVAGQAVAAGVATGTLDLGLVDGVAAPSDPLRLPDIGPVTTALVAEEQLTIALPAGHPLARRAGLRLEDLADAHWIDAPEVTAPLADLRAATGSDGFRTWLRYQGADVRSLVALVAAGHGLALLPRSAVEGATGVVAVPLSSPRLVHRTELLHGSLAGTTAVALATALTAARSR